jgi:hypothetical protein
MKVEEVIKFMEAHGFIFRARGEDGDVVVLHFTAPSLPAIIEVATPIDRGVELNEAIFKSLIARANCGCVNHAEQGIPCQHDQQLN